MCVWTQDGIETPVAGLLSTSSSNSVVPIVGPTDSATHGPTIDVFLNLGGGRCLTDR
jgi:hypothetical protein